MAKLMKTGVGSDKGLVSLDGAGQAGIILSHIGRMPLLHQACITARYATRYEECPCCLNKDKMTDEYRAAIDTLSEWAAGQVTGITLRNMRAAIVRSFYERGVSILSASKELNVAKSTAHDQKAKIFKALKVMDAAAQAGAESHLNDMCVSADK